MEKFRRQESVTLSVEYYSAGVLTAPDTYTIEVKDESGQIVVDSQPMAEDDTGLYSYEYTSASTVPLGVYTAEAVLTTGTNKQRPYCKFEIVEEIP